MLSGRPQQRRRLQSLAYKVRHHRHSVPHKLKSSNAPQVAEYFLPGSLSLVKEDDSVSTLLSALVRCRDSHVRMY